MWISGRKFKKINFNLLFMCHKVNLFHLCYLYPNNDKQIWCYIFIMWLKIAVLHS